MTLNKERGHSITLLGGVSNKWNECQYILANKTTAINVVEWLDSISGSIDADGATVVIDNHRAHHTALVKSKAHELKLELLFMPATASEMNPQELVWANFKKNWRRFLYDPELEINHDNAEAYIHLAMKEVNDL